ncbi:site-2 protease family protein [Candidatus Saccharibacteria bacterium]|nr:site-2 protease family protein [Candidatus Saccharibacteria bacterium]
MDIFVGVIVGLLVLMLLVTAHEFGHFLAARRNGVRVLEFGIGFPPRGIAWVKNPETKKWQRLPRSEWNNPQKGLIFSLNILPIGGFCQMDGESANDKRKGTFGHARFWAKTKILFAGVAMNWLLAFIILTILAWTGMPNFLENQFRMQYDETIDKGAVTIAEVLDESPAKAAGLQSGDRIVAIDGAEVIHATEVTKYNTEHADKTVVYTIERTEEIRAQCDCPAETECNCPSVTDTVEKVIPVKLNPADAEYLLGVTMKSDQTLYRYGWSAPVVGIGLTAQMTGETIKGLGDLIWNVISGVAKQFNPNDATREEGRAALNTASDSVSGPVGIIGVIFPAFTSAGPTNLAFLAALISISLACMNVLPIPALDGGRWLLILIYKLRKKELSKEKEEKIVSRAFLFLLILIALITILDISRFF